MKPDDPDLTAYALGELDPNAQSEAARELAGSPEVAAEAWEIRAFGARLKRELQTEPAPGLRPGQRNRIFAEVDRAAAIIEAERYWWRSWVPAAVAACAAMVIGGSFFVESQQLAKWWAQTTKLHGFSLSWTDEPAEKAPESLIPPVDPAVPNKPTLPTASATPQFPHRAGLSLPPEPKSTARLTQPPRLDVQSTPAAPTVDPATIPMTGRMRITSRQERLRERMAASAPTASPTPTPKTKAEAAESR